MQHGICLCASNSKDKFIHVCHLAWILVHLIHQTVVAQWIRPWTLNPEVSGSYLLAAAVVPLGKAHYLHCLVPRKGL